jgi:sortase A
MASTGGTARWPRFRLGLELTLWIVAAATLGYAGWMAADAGLYQLRAEREVEAMLERLPPGNDDPGRGVRAEPGAPVGRLSIPAVDLSVVVAEGIDDDVLRRAVGRMPRSAWPGEDGNVVLAGHRDTFLRELEHVRVGERILLESASGRHEYEIEWTDVVDPDAVEVIADTAYPALTLVTCYPFRYVGPAPRRFVVRARQLAADQTAAAPSALRSES